jgi:hypothetical protein
MKEALRPSAVRPVLAIFGFALAMLLLGAFGARSAQAEELKFCWGETIEKTGPDSVCFEGAVKYATGIYAHGVEHSICVNRLGAKASERKCSPGPEQGVFLPLTPDESLTVPKIETNGGGSTKVYGVVYYNPPPPPPPPPPSWHYDNVGGGTIVGDPALSSSGYKKLDIFVRGLDNNLWQKWSLDGGVSWSAFQNISAVVGGSIASSPGSVSWGVGRVDIVARMPNGSVGHWYHNGSWNFENLGGTIVGDPEIASTGNGHLNVFVRGEDGNLWQKWTSDGGASWSGFQNLSAVLGGPIASGPGAVSALANSLTVVARLPDSTVGVWSWVNNAWSFQSLTGQILGDPDIASSGSGRVNIFATGLDNNLWQKWTTGSGWYGWQQLSASPLGSGPSAVGWWGYTRMDVVSRMADGTIGHWWFG